MTERRRAPRRGRAQDPSPDTATDASSTAAPKPEPAVEANPYLELSSESPAPKKGRGAKTAKSTTTRTPRARKTAKSSDAGEGAAERAPVERGSVERGPVESAPVERAPVERPPVEHHTERHTERPAPPPPPQTYVAEAPPAPQGESAPSQSYGSQHQRPDIGGDGNGGSNYYNQGDGNDEGRFNNQRRGRFRRFRHRNNRNNPQQGGDRQQNAPNNFNGQQGGGHYNNQGGHSQNTNFGGRRNHNNNRRNNNRPQHHDHLPRGPVGPVVVEGETTGWFDTQRDAGFIRSPRNSYLADPSDPFIPASVVRQFGLRRGDQITASVGRDQRNRMVVADILAVNGNEPTLAMRRPDFQSLIASYPDRKLTLETGKPAKGGPELTRRAIDLIAPIGFGQRALIVAPARAGKTMLLQAVIEGIAVNHSHAELFVLLVDERPEEVSDMITLGYGEVIASSFDMPAARHTDVAEMTLERARRLVEMGRDVVIVLDSITRLARAYNTVERGTGRTLSGGLDSSAMAKPKAFFGSARSVAPEHGGGSLTIIATALVETGSRMDDVIFEEFKGTGNCEIKLDRSLAEKRIFPAIDIAISGTRREDKLFRPDQLDHVYTLRRGLQQMPSSSGMEWLIKRIASTTNNDALLVGL